MVLAWSVLIPFGILGARFLKVLPRQDWPNELDNRSWWHLHRGLQVMGVLIATLGVYLGSRISQGASPTARVHGMMGWGLITIGWLQIMFGMLRGTKGGPTDAAMAGDHYDMTVRRRWFEAMHKLIGWAALPVAMATTSLGLWIADAPRWMVLVIALWWLALAGVACWLQRRGLAVDTYQAIWGPDPVHPGNRMPGQGWGMRRHNAESLARAFGRDRDEGGKGK